MYKSAIIICMFTFTGCFALRDPFLFGRVPVSEQVFVQSVDVCAVEKINDEISGEKNSSEWKVIEHLHDGTLIQNSEGSIRKIKLLK